MIFSFQKKNVVTFLALLGIFLAIFSMVTAPAVVIDIESSVSLPLNVYYYNGEKSGYPFDEAHLTKSVPLSAAQRQTVRFLLSRKDMCLLRFDFGSDPAAVTVYEITLQCSPFERYHFVGSAIARAFPSLNCIDSVSEGKDAVTYVTTGVDGFIAADLNLLAMGEKSGISLTALGALLAGFLFAFLVSFTHIPQLVIRRIFTAFSTLFESLNKTFTLLVEKFPHIRQWVVCALLTLLCLISIWAGPQYILLNLAYSLGLGLCVSVVWEEMRKLRHEERRDLLVLAVMVAVAALPMMLTTFYYGDDYWSFYPPLPTGYRYSSGIAFRRPMTGPMDQMVRKLDYRVLHLRRSVMVLVLILCVILIYELVLRYHGRRRWAFSVSLLLAAGVATLDSIAYLVTVPILFGILFSLCAFTYYQRAQEESKWNYLVFVLLLLDGFCFYQIATPILFVPFLFALYHGWGQESTNFKNAFKLLLSYGVVAVGYLLSTQLLMTFYGVAPVQTSRAKISLDPHFYIEKLKWFCMTVLPQSVNKAFALLFGMHNFTTNNLFYVIHFRSPVLEVLVLAVSAALVTVYFARFLVRRRYATVFIAMVGIVLTFYPFLILPESTVLSYYMIPLILLMGYYILSGFWILWDIACRRWEKFRTTAGRILSAGCALAVIVLAANGSIYSNNWVNYNRDSYQYITQSLAQSVTPTTDTVMVYGVMSPYVGGNDYVVLAVRRAMDELGMDSARYTVLQSDNAYYSASMTEANMAIMKTVLSEEEYAAFSKFYMHDDLYSRFLYTYSADQDDLPFLQSCLIRAGLLFKEPSDSACIIYLDGFNQTHVW